MVQVNNKKIIVISLILTVILSLFAMVFAEDNGNFDIAAIEGSKTEVEKVDNLTRTTLGAAISITRIVATGTLVIVLTIIASKYMIAAPGDRADIKKHAVAFTIAALVIFCSTFLVEMLINLSSSFNTGAAE